ncbi:Do family serine endopeptidase [Methylobrevis albus]|uniref:Probable periplasmic serine endoprotease DegP-like n=1 Tax=Methylobrevis albus TaxID=2793297 RepID=A0A931I1K3_9HYPH|nr:Do family serine endopeptidase [Methylobrevis albus]MBH0237588.1 Do family serine endopeptidase [Methylobrevis albus]
MIGSSIGPKINRTSGRRHIVSAALTAALAASVATFAVVAPVAAENVSEGAPATALVDFTSLVERVQPAVVSIRVRGEAPSRQTSRNLIPQIPDDHPLQEFFRRFGEEGIPGLPNIPGMPGGRGGDEPSSPRPFAQSQGSGFFVSADGFVVTNNHVVENSSEVTVVLNDQSELEATVVGTDPKTDLALLKVTGRDDFNYVTLADADPKVGEWVVAVGNPFGLGGSVTVGIVSARGRDIGAGPYDDFLQIDASINRGNSGGPAFNLQGEVIGVNTAIFSPSGGSVGIGFAIPAAVVTTVIESLKENGVVTRGWLGVQIQPVTQDIADSIGLDTASGALVTEPQPDGPGIAAGIRSGDVVLKVDDTDIDSPRALARRIASYAPGSTVTLGIWRNGEAQTLEVELGTLPADQQQAALTPPAPIPDEPTRLDSFGLTVAPASSREPEAEGVVIVSVTPDGPAAERGLAEGDIILEVGGKAVSRPADIEQSIRTASESGRKAVLMRVRSGDQVRFVALSLGRV